MEKGNPKSGFPLSHRPTCLRRKDKTGRLQKPRRPWLRVVCLPCLYLYDPVSLDHLSRPRFPVVRAGKRDDLLTRMNDCAECIRLWREYATATTDHIGLEGKMRIAMIAHDSARVALLSPQVAGADVKRTAARNAIEVHERHAHPSSNAAEA
jgi:hypothetical protein